ncbi:MAG: N-acetylmuramoyl-L-alanine amidase [Lachnospiraceae bacterium]
MSTYEKYRKKRKQRVILSRIGVILLLIIFSILMGCGCMYIIDYFYGDRAEAEHSDSYSNNNRNNYMEKNEVQENSIENNKYNTVTDDQGEKEDESVLCVALDAGHGGKDLGTSGYGYDEKDINLQVVMKIKAKLELKGIKVILTRSDDRFLELEERAEIANEEKADLFVSIHCNYIENNESIYGLECYYHPSSPEGEDFASIILDNVSENHSIYVRNSKPEDFSVLRNTKMPAVLVELGYMSNFDECQKLIDDSYQDILAETITAGIIEKLYE